MTTSTGSNYGLYAFSAMNSYGSSGTGIGLYAYDLAGLSYRKSNSGYGQINATNSFFRIRAYRPLTP